MKNDRRNFLKIAGAAALGVGLGKTSASPEKIVRAPIPDPGPTDGLTKAQNSVVEEKPMQDLNTPPPRTAKQWGMIIDTRKLKTLADVEPKYTGSTRPRG